MVTKAESVLALEKRAKEFELKLRKAEADGRDSDAFTFSREVNSLLQAASRVRKGLVSPEQGFAMAGVLSSRIGTREQAAARVAARRIQIQRKPFVVQRITPAQRLRIKRKKAIIQPRPRAVQPFITPSFVKRQKIRLGDLTSRIVRRGIQFGADAVSIKREVDTAISRRLKQLGVTDKNIKKFSEKSITGTDIFKYQNPEFFTEQLDKAGILKKVKKVETELQVGAVKEVRDKPTTAPLAFGVGRALPSTLKFLGGTKLIKKVGKATPKTIKKIGKVTIPKALIGAYLTTSGLQVAAQPKGKRVQKVGGILVTEVLPFQIGTERGVRGVLRKEVKKEIQTTIAKLPKNKRDAFRELTAKANLLTKTRTTVRDLTLKRLKRIPEKAKPAILKFLKERDVIVGGSLGQQTAVKVKRTLAQSDLDLYMERGHVKAARDLANRLRKQGIKRVSQIRGQVTIGGKKAAEFHNIDRLIANIESVIPSWKNPKSFITRTPKGIRVPKITVQLKRKLVGGFTDPKRAKDLKDARDILNQLFKRAELQARGKFFFREKNIKALEKAFGVKISRKLVNGKKVSPTIKVIRAIVKGAKPKITTKVTKAKRLKKPIIIEKPPLIARKKAGVGKGISKKPKPSQPKVKIKRPSQPPVRRPPSQAPPSQKPKKPSPPSQPPPKKPPRKSPPSQPPKRPPRRPPPITPPRKPSPPSQPPKRPPRKPPPTKVPPPTKPPRRPPRKATPFLPVKKRKIKFPKKKPQQGFFIEEKQGGRFKKLKGKLLSRKDALDRLAWRLNNRLSRTARIKRATKTKRLGTIPKRMVGAYGKTKRNLRDYRIVKGKRVKMKNTFIEKKRFGINTKGEKQQLRLNRLAKAKRTTRKKKK